MSPQAAMLFERVDKNDDICNYMKEYRNCGAITEAKKEEFMKDLKKRLFELIYYDEDTVAMDERVNKEVAKYLQHYTCSMTKEQKEECQALVYDMTAKAEYEGFWLGIKYAFKLICQIQ